MSDSTLLRGIGLVRDVTEQWREREFQKLLVGELNHRMKNMFTILRSLISMTTTDGRSSEEFKQAILGRLQALSHGLTLTESATSDGVSLHDLATAVLKPFQFHQRRIAVSGPPTAIPPRLSRVLSLVIHEVVTNAIKYGALSVDEGGAALSWTAEQLCNRQKLVLDWRETGGPPVMQPTRRGFGSRLLQQLAALETKGEAVVSYDTGGLSYRLEMEFMKEDLQQSSDQVA